MSVRLLEVARGELDEAIAHYNKERPGLGEAFLASAEESLDARSVSR